MVEMALKAQSRHEADDSKDLETFQYILDGAIAKERRAQNTVTSLQNR